ncbi:MAG TPA: divergent polysaccharide deacetylase family protein [Spirochaetia bacterium]|nr:divergent polysaccharide deacetylase family protein [Spirochaetia bacterium]HRZ66016.1 divergent polysaccharide deacetylase family protein [Spirochaetia bacterium]
MAERGRESGRRRAPKRGAAARGGARRRPAARKGEAFAFAAASLACLALALGVAAACGLLREPAAPAAALPEAPQATSASPAEPGAAAPAAPAALPAAEPPARTVPLKSLPAASAPPKPPQARPASRRSTSYREPRRPPPPRPRKTLIFVIDDAGHNLRDLKPFLELPFPLTVAVLPRLARSAEAAAAVRAAGKELILHQPMAALGGEDPGPGALYPEEGPEEAARVVEENLAGLPGARGMNNHMGSAVTTEPRIMEAVAAIAKRRGIYYLDSLTVSGTASREAAHREGIRYWERDVFLDNAPDRASILRAVEEGKKRADSGRPAVMIGHVWSAELAKTLMELYPQLIDEGYSLSTISRYMLSESSEDADSRD